MNISSLRGITLFASLVLFFAGRSQALILDADVPGNKPAGISAAIVGGRPAAAWVNQPFTEVKYARALDADGNAWGQPVTLYTDAGGATPFFSPSVSLQMVDGRPAVCFSPPGSGELTYVRATDATGAQWGEPVKVYSAGPEVYGLAMAVVDGKPAIAYSPMGVNELRFVRATAADGSAWGTPASIWGGSFRRIYLMSAGGKPAVVSATNSVLVTLRALDPAGDKWNGEFLPQWLLGYQPLGYAACEVPGGLAIASTLKEISSSQINRMFTGPAGTEYLGADSPNSMAMVGGKLAMVNYRDSALYFVESQNQNGYGPPWKTPVKVLNGSGLLYPVLLLEVNSTPGILFVDPNGLNYLHLHPGGQPPPEMRVEIPGAPAGSNVLASGSAVDFGKRRIGENTPKTYAVRNVNAGSVDLADLIVDSLSIDGPDAADFTVTASPAGKRVQANGSTPLTIQFSPRSPGRKSAALHMVFNNSGASPFNLALSGDSYSTEIEVHRTGGELLDSSRPLFLPPLAAGVSREYSLTIRNPGTVELSGLAVSIDGPDGAEFSVVSPPAASVAPGGSTTFLLRHAPAVTGPRTAMLHIASHVTGFNLPYNIPVKAAPGIADPSFNPASFTGQVQAMALRANSSILVSTSSSLTCLRPDGTPDPSFSSPAVSPNFVTCIAALHDGKFLISGDFDSVNGRPRPGLARLNADGSFDESFAPGIQSHPLRFAVQPDGKILIVIDFSQAVHRLFPDGAYDASFYAKAEGSTVMSMAMEEDGHILMGGAFDAINDVPVTRLARVEANGTAHAFGAIPPYVSPNVRSTVRCLAVQADGRVIAGGDFPGGVLRFTPDGRPDPFPSFSGAYTLALQADGACLVGTGSQDGIVKVSPSGQKDSTFQPDSMAGNRQFLHEAGGSLLVTTTAPGSPNARLVRLFNDPTTSEMQVADGGTMLRWLRGGTAPEVSDVIFQSAAPDWTLLGKGTRIPGGWELSGLSLPATGAFRALGRAAGSVIESVLSFLSPLESWRLQYFNTSSNTGAAADDADPDKDGLTNFTEFAFGLNPVDRASNLLPEFKYANNSLTATFAAPEGRDDVIYGAESSPTMLPGTWSAVPDTGAEVTHVFSVSGQAAKAFVRFVLHRR